MSYQHPQPRKSNTGLIAAIVALVLVIAGVGIALAITLSGGSDDSADDKKSDDPSQSESSSETASESSSSETSPTPSTDGPRITGQDYSYPLPEGWIDVSDDPKAASAPSIDTVAAWGKQLTGARANVIVEAGPAAGATEPEQAREKWLATMEAAVQSKGEAIPDITIAGKPAIGYQFQTTSSSGVKVVQWAYYAINGSTAHSIALSVPEQDSTEARKAFDEMLAAWTWN